MLASLAGSTFLAGFVQAQTVIDTPQTTPELIIDDEDLTITETGEINVTTPGTDSAIVINVPSYTSTFANYGSIGREFGGQNEGVGVLLLANIADTARIENNGTVSINSTNVFSSWGYLIVGDVAGTFDNSGELRITAIGSSGTITATGITYATAPMVGNFNNTGSVFAQAEATLQANARGVELGGGLTGLFTNTGDIRAIATSETNTAYAESIRFWNPSTGVLVNNGNLYASSTGERVSTARGILMSGIVIGLHFENTGNIEAVSRTTDGHAQAYGVAVFHDMTGTISNTGSIVARSDDQAYGLWITTFDGVINDVGRITAYSETGQAYAIYFVDGTGTINIDSEDDVTGLIRVNGHNINLDAQGSSNIFYFEDADPETGQFLTTVSDEGSYWFVEDEGGEFPIYTAVGTEDLTPGGVPLGELAALYGYEIGNSRRVLAYDTPIDVTRGYLFQSGETGLRPWVVVDAENSQLNTDSGDTVDVSIFDGEAGFHGQTDSGLAFAAGLGGFRANGHDSDPDFNTTGIYVDAAIGRQFGSWTVDAGFGFGWLSTERTRQITGSSDADADYDSTLLTAHLGVEKSFETGGNIDLVGFGDVRYTQQKDDGYTETGSDANATVGEVTTEVIEARLGLEASKAFSNGGTLKGQLAGVVRRGLGDTDADVTVFSDTQTLTFASTDFTGGSVAIGYEHSLSQGIDLEVIAEQEIGSDAQGPYLRAGFKWAF